MGEDGVRCYVLEWEKMARQGLLGKAWVDVLAGTCLLRVFHE
jgi:hypothetical protein